MLIFIHEFEAVGGIHRVGLDIYKTNDINNEFCISNVCQKKNHKLLTLQLRLLFYFFLSVFFSETASK